MQATVTDEVSAINQAIAERIGPQKYRVWFKNSTRMSITADYLKVGIPNHFIGSWIESHFLDDICSAVRSVTGSDKKITFSIEPELTGSQRRPQLDSQAKQVQRAHNVNIRRRTIQKDSNLAPLKLKLENFIVGPGNQLAHNAARAV